VERRRGDDEQAVRSHLYPVPGDEPAPPADPLAGLALAAAVLLAGLLVALAASVIALGVVEVWELILR
jgi:hypothetical protein